MFQRDIDIVPLIFGDYKFCEGDVQWLTAFWYGKLGKVLVP